MGRMITQIVDCRTEYARYDYMHKTMLSIVGLGMRPARRLNRVSAPPAAVDACFCVRFAGDHAAVRMYSPSFHNNVLDETQKKRIPHDNTIQPKQTRLCYFSPSRTAASSIGIFRSMYRPVPQ